MLRHKSNLILAIVVFMLVIICSVTWQWRTQNIIWPEITGLPIPEAPLSDIAPMATLPLTEHAATWERPLFNPKRQPDQVAATPPPTAPSLDDVVVTGIMVAGETRLALIKQGENRLKVLEGEFLLNGWKVTMISQRQVQFSYGETNETLWLSGTKPKL